jgi:hypothetical protein
MWYAGIVRAKSVLWLRGCGSAVLAFDVWRWSMHILDQISRLQTFVSLQKYLHFTDNLIFVPLSIITGLALIAYAAVRENKPIAHEPLIRSVGWTKSKRRTHVQKITSALAVPLAFIVGAVIVALIGYAVSLWNFQPPAITLAYPSMAPPDIKFIMPIAAHKTLASHIARPYKVGAGPNLSKSGRTSAPNGQGGTWHGFGGCLENVGGGGTAGLGGHLDVSPLSLYFDDRTLGTISAAKSITVRNPNAIALPFVYVSLMPSYGNSQEMMLQGNHDLSFQISLGSCLHGIAANGECEVEVSFLPRHSGPQIYTAGICGQYVDLQGNGK